MRIPILVFCCGLAAGAAQLPEPHHKVPLPVEVREKVNRRWENGFLAARDVYAPHVYLYGLGGTKLWQATVRVEGAAQVSLRGLAVWPDGSVAVSGGYGVEGSTLFGFLAFFDAAGKVVRRVDTAPFLPLRLCVTADGKLWALGRILTGAESDIESPGGILRSYSAAGEAMESVLPRQDIPPLPHPAVTGMLAARGRTVGLFNAHSGEWIEVSSESGAVLSRHRIARPEGLKIDGMAYAPNGDLYVSGTLPDAPIFARIERGSLSWTPLDPVANRRIYVAGADARSLVLYNGAPELLWVAPPD